MNLKEKHTISIKSSVDRAVNGMFESINEDFEAVSQVLFRDWMYPYVENQGMTRKDFVDGTSERFRSNVFKNFGTVFNNNFMFFPNNDLKQVLKNISNFAKKKYPEKNPSEFIKNMGYEGGFGSSQDFLLSHVYPSFTNNYLSESVIYAGAYAAKTTKLRKVDSKIEEIDFENYLAHSIFSTLSGVSTTREVALFNSGRKMRVLKHIPNNGDSNMEYFPESGKYIFSVSAKRQVGETMESSWPGYYSKLPFLKRMLTSNLDRAMSLTKYRQVSLERILENFEMILLKDLDDMRSYDKTTYYHNIAVGDLSLLFARVLNIPLEERMALSYGAYKHDKGKKMVPQSILRYEGKLKPEQFRIMMEHTQLGFVKDVEFSLNILNGLFTESSRSDLDESFGIGFSKKLYDRLKTTIVKGAYLMCEHQEMYDGMGYPHRLRENEISLAGHLIKVIDEMDAFSRVRPYKGEESNESVMKMVRSGVGTRTHPILGEFISDMKGKFYDMGYHHGMFSDESEGSSLDKLLSAYIRGNVDIDVSVPSEVQNFVENYISPSYNVDDLLKRCDRSFDGFFDDILLNEMSRKYVESNPDHQFSRRLQSVMRGNIFDVRRLDHSDLRILRQHFSEEISDMSLDSYSYIKDLKEGMPHRLIRMSENPIHHSYNWQEQHRVGDYIHETIGDIIEFRKSK